MRLIGNVKGAYRHGWRMVEHYFAGTNHCKYHDLYNVCLAVHVRHFPQPSPYEISNYVLLTSVWMSLPSDLGFSGIFRQYKIPCDVRPGKQEDTQKFTRMDAGTYTPTVLY